MRYLRSFLDILPARHDTLRILLLGLGSGATFLVSRLAAGTPRTEAITWTGVAFGSFVVFGLIIEALSVVVYGRRVWPAALSPLHSIVNAAARTNEIVPALLPIDDWIFMEEAKAPLRQGDQVHSLTCDLLTIDGREVVQRYVAQNLRNGAEYTYYLPRDQDLKASVLEVVQSVKELSGLDADTLRSRMNFYEISTPVLYNFSYMRTLGQGEWVSWYLLTPPGGNRNEHEGMVVVHSLQGANGDIRRLLAKLRRWPAGRSISF